MSFEGLLAIVGIVIAVYAIPQAPQRRSIILLVPVWIVPLELFLSAGILVWREGVPIFGYEFYPWSDFLSTIIAFLLPVIAMFIGILYWLRAKLKKSKNKKFYDFVMASLYDKTFDELIRIVEKNKDYLSAILEPSTLDLLFEQSFVREMSQRHTWLHLHLLSDEKKIKQLPNCIRAVDTVMRELIQEPSSPLCAAVAYAYCAEEHPFFTDSDRKLLENTLQNPDWYIKLRADYPLLMVACEKLYSGTLDDAYNRNNELYIAHQGVTSRSRCPVFLAMKTHVLMLEKTIKLKNGTDYYVSDLYDLFRTICDHSIYDKSVWESFNANREFPTPFVFLMKEILSDLSFLCDHRYSYGNQPPGRIGHDLVSTWTNCLIWLAESNSEVSPNFKIGSMRSYLDFGLELRQAYVHENTNETRKANCSAWSELFINQLKEKIGQDNNIREILINAADKLDICTDHVSENHQWLRKELGLPDRPRV